MASSLSILVVPDKFKGTCSAAQAARSIARGWQQVRPQDQLNLLPMSDGGDGFGPIIGGLLGAHYRRSRTVDAAHQPIRSAWWWHPEKRLAIIESARTIGLALLPAEQRRPFTLDTRGLAKPLLAAARAGAQQCLVGIGGSATNDGGFGMASALGWRFLDKAGKLIGQWPQLSTLATILPPATPPLGSMQITVAVDVQNPLLGPSGATRIYGPQKGLSRGELARAESALARLAEVVRKRSGKAIHQEPGAGAAGGLGFGLSTFCNSRFQSGSQIFAETSRIERLLESADLVITAEGQMDSSSLMGKGVGDIARRAAEFGKPCLGIGGRIKDRTHLHGAFQDLCALTPELTQSDLAIQNPGYWIRHAAQKLAQRLDVLQARAKRKSAR